MSLNRSVANWTVRLLLAGLLLFGSEIILWTDPLSHSIIEWIVRIVGYILLATLTLDVAQRYRIRDAYDAMILLAATALVHGLLINPVLGWAEFPSSLLTRIIGSDALVQLIMWGILLTWLRSNTFKYAFYPLIAALWLGIYWGFWMRWIPELRATFEAVPLMQLFIIAGVVFAIIVLFYYLVTVQVAKNLEADDLMLTPLEWGIALLFLIILFLYQAILGTIGAGAVVLTLILLLLCWVILWLRREDDEVSLLEQHLPLEIRSPLWILLMAVAFAIATTISYQLPLFETAFVNQLWLMEIGSFAMGLLWLPVVASVIASRAVDRFMREGMTT